MKEHKTKKRQEKNYTSSFQHNLQARYFFKKKCFAIIFWGITLAYCMIQIIFSSGFSFFQGGWSACVQSTYGNRLIGFSQWRNLNGALNYQLGKKEINDFKFVKDKEGFLHYSLFYQEHDRNQPTRYAKSIKWMHDLYKDKKVYYVNVPSRYQPSNSRYFSGIPYQNTHVLQEDLQLALEQYNVPIIDVEAALKENSIPYDTWFYRTDLHWRTETALFAAQQIGKILNTDNISIQLPFYITAKSYSQDMLGTEGTIVDKSYVGSDDFTLLLPEDSSTYRWTGKGENESYIQQEGNAEKAFLQSSQLQYGNAKEYNRYAAYFDGSKAWQSIENLQKPSAPRFLFIGDTFCNPLLAYLAPVCSQVNQINPLAGNIDVEAHLKENEYDAIFILFYPGNLTDAAFNFFHEKPLMIHESDSPS